MLQSLCRDPAGDGPCDKGHIRDVTAKGSPGPAGLLGVAGLCLVTGKQAEGQECTAKYLYIKATAQGVLPDKAVAAHL